MYFLGIKFNPITILIVGGVFYLKKNQRNKKTKTKQKPKKQQQQNKNKTKQTNKLYHSNPYYLV